MDLVISNTGSEPIYAQIVTQIKNMIITDKLKEADPLPSMRLLAKELRISVITTKRAYEELEREGFITSIPGKGSFVASKNTEFLRELQYREIEDHLQAASDKAQAIGMNLPELAGLLEIIYKGDAL